MLADLDISDPENISLINVNLVGEFSGGPLSFYENIAYIASDLGYYIYNCDDPGMIFSFDWGDLRLPKEWEWSLKIPIPVFLNNYGFVAKEDKGLYVIDAADPLNPYWLYRYDGIPVGIKEQEIIIPVMSHLDQNYPNPFNPATTINYQLTADSQVELTIYDLTGRKVAILIDRYQSSGYHTVNWNASFLPSGIYLYRLKAGDFVETKKMVLMK